jgi:hypothetical protein
VKGPPDLTNDDKAILAELLRETIERDRFPLSPRIRAEASQSRAADAGPSALCCPAQDR